MSSIFDMENVFDNKIIRVYQNLSSKETVKEMVDCITKLSLEDFEMTSLSKYISLMPESTITKKIEKALFIVKQNNLYNVIKYINVRDIKKKLEEYDLQTLIDFKTYLTDKMYRFTNQEFVMKVIKFTTAVIKQKSDTADAILNKQIMRIKIFKILSDNI